MQDSEFLLNLYNYNGPSYEVQNSDSNQMNNPKARNLQNLENLFNATSNLSMQEELLQAPDTPFLAPQKIRNFDLNKLYNFGINENNFPLYPSNLDTDQMMRKKNSWQFREKKSSISSFSNSAAFFDDDVIGMQEEDDGNHNQPISQLSNSLLYANYQIQKFPTPPFNKNEVVVKQEQYNQNMIMNIKYEDSASVTSTLKLQEVDRTFSSNVEDFEDDDENDDDEQEQDEDYQDGDCRDYNFNDDDDQSTQDRNIYSDSSNPPNLTPFNVALQDINPNAPTINYPGSYPYFNQLAFTQFYMNNLITEQQKQEEEEKQDFKQYVQNIVRKDGQKVIEETPQEKRIQFEEMAQYMYVGPLTLDERIKQILKYQEKMTKKQRTAPAIKYEKQHLAVLKKPRDKHGKFLQIQTGASLFPLINNTQIM